MVREALKGGSLLSCLVSNGFRGFESHSRRVDDMERHNHGAGWQSHTARSDKPGDFLPALLKKGSVIADIGCGTGYYCQYLIEYASFLYCVDTDQDALGKVSELLSDKAAVNFKVLRTPKEIPDCALDAVLFANSFHDMGGKEVMVQEVSRMLKEDGVVIVVDWKKGERGGFGPPEAIRMSEEDYLALFKCFVIVRRFAAGEGHFGIVMQATNPVNG